MWGKACAPGWAMLVQFRDWRLCWCTKGRSLVEQKFCNRKLREKRLGSCWIIKLAGKDGPNLNFWVKVFVAAMLTREEDFALATFQKEAKYKQRRAMQSSLVSNRVNRKSMLLPQFQPEVAIISSSYCRSIQGRAKECVVACDCLYVSVSVFKAAGACLYMFRLCFFWNPLEKYVEDATTNIVVQ